MNISKITLTRVYASDKDKNGVPFVAKTTGRPYKKMSVKCIEHGDKWLSGFQGRENEFWKEGDVVDVIIKQNGEYLNYEVPKAEDKLAMRVSALEVEVLNLRNMFAKLPTQPASKAVSGPEDYGTVLNNPSAMDEPDF